MSWCIDDGEGNGICEGLQSERQARDLAQRKANAREKSFFIYESGSEASEEIAPESD